MHCQNKEGNEQMKEVEKGESRIDGEGESRIDGDGVGAGSFLVPY